MNGSPPEDARMWSSVEVCGLRFGRVAERRTRFTTSLADSYFARFDSYLNHLVEV